MTRSAGGCRRSDRRSVARSHVAAARQAGIHRVLPGASHPQGPRRRPVGGRLSWAMSRTPRPASALPDVNTGRALPRDTASGERPDRAVEDFHGADQRPVPAGHRRRADRALTLPAPGSPGRLRARGPGGVHDRRSPSLPRLLPLDATIYYLPPYAPGLNPVEGIWSLLRRDWLSNVAFSTPEHLIPAHSTRPAPHPVLRRPHRRLPRRNGPDRQHMTTTTTRSTS